MIKNFSDLWRAHFELSQDVLVKEIKPLKTVDVYIGNTPDAWYNFALPKVKKPAELNLEEVKKVLFPISPPTTIYLWEKHIKTGFTKFLTKNSYEFMGTDTWVVLKPKGLKKLKVEIPVEHIGLSKFPDYDKVTVEVFKEEDYDNRPYVEVCRKSLTGEMKSKVPGFSSEFFMIYENNHPAAGAGLFLTEEIGYFHNDATFKEYRKRGYHTALIKERIEFCLDRGVKTLYSIVEHKGQSFRNYNKCDFETWQVCNLFTLKSK